MASRRPVKLNLEIPFTKYQAVGNDFIVTDLFAMLFHRFAKWPGPQHRNADTALGVDVRVIARSICDRHTGVGADGLLVMFPPQEMKHQARMSVYNADGSEAEMSGNGI